MVLRIDFFSPLTVNLEHKLSTHESVFHRLILYGIGHELLSLLG